MRLVLSTSERPTVRELEDFALVHNMLSPDPTVYVNMVIQPDSQFARIEVEVPLDGSGGLIARLEVERNRKESGRVKVVNYCSICKHNAHEPGECFTQATDCMCGAQT